MAFVLAAAVFGSSKGDRTMLGIAFAGLLLAGSTWMSAKISSFLRIFAGIFAVEYVVFGLLTLLIRAGLWPEALADFGPPSSLPDHRRRVRHPRLGGVPHPGDPHASPASPISISTRATSAARRSGRSARCGCARAASPRSPS